MFRGLLQAQHGTVIMKLSFDSADPPVGLVVLGDGLEQPFEGWLQLLGILSRALEPPRA